MATNAEYLAAVPFFSSLSSAERDALAEECTRQKLEPKAVLFKQGAAAHTLYIIISGQVAVLQRVEGGGEEQVATRGPGDVIGEMAILEESPRSATIICVRSTKMLALSRESFESFLRRHPTASISMVRVMSKRLRDLTSEMVRMRSKPLSAQLLDLMVARCDASGLVALAESQSALAAQFGCTREALNRNLRKLESEGLITSCGSKTWKLER